MPKARIQKRLYYKIGEACKALDIQPYVLRYWETEFSAISPSKSRSGQRVYSEKELEIIRRIKQLLYDEGYTIAGAKKKLEAELAGGTLSRADDGKDDEAPSELDAPAAAPAAELTAQEPAAPPLQASLLLEDRSASSLDTQGDERIQRLRSGVERALDEARDLLALLSSRRGT